MKGIYINEMGLPEDAILSTAIDDFSLRTIGDEQMILHCFQHSGINMGWDDTRLPGYPLGKEYYKKKGIPLFLRNAGGRSIVADEGVLNMSLTLTGISDYKEAYRYYDLFIKEALAPYTTRIETKEIHGAYCPGDTDLSLMNKKFCGTAQRKRRNATNLVSYISVSGNQDQRGELVKGFYEAMGDYPIVIEPQTMETLSRLTAQLLTPVQIASQFFETLKKRCDHIQVIRKFNPDYPDLQKSIQATLRRNQ